MNTPVSFPLAKLLKEKGFNLKVVNFFNYERLSLISDKDRQIEGLVNYNPINWNSIKNYYTSAPTISDVVMWLYEKHGIWIYPFRHDFNNEFYWHIDTPDEDEFTSDMNFNSPTEAYEAAIKYCLEKII